LHDLQTTQDKLLKTPTGDVHGSFYRKLVSAGYKGHIGGMFGGGALYGTIGLVVGVVVGIPLAIAMSPLALWLIPALGVTGMAHGVHVFSDIGTTAGIIAESASIRETRNHLLDRYYETQSEEERQEIQKMLDEQLESKPPEHMFHWKPLLIGAAIGAVVMLVCAVGFPHIAPMLLGVLDHLPT